MRQRVCALLFVAAAVVTLPAQLRVRPVADETGEVQLQLMFRKLRTAGTFMMTTAHPDDENNGLLVQMAWGAGVRTVLVTATRGDGGQNEIGPEIFDGLAVLRTEELMALHRFDGAEQLFTRAVDFGYSFSIDETYEKWGKDEIIGDYVRQIRAVRPDVIAGFLWDGTSGGLHHQASTHLTAEAFRAAADPKRYPEQIAAGLRPWQASKFYSTGSFGGPQGTEASTPGYTPVNTSGYDPVLGRTYDEIGAEARTMHKCQGTSQVPALLTTGGGIRGYQLRDSVLPGPPAKETSLLDGIDMSLPGLARFAGLQPSLTLVTELRSIVRDVDDAERGFKAGGLAGAIEPLASGLHELRTLRAQLSGMGLGADAVYEIDFRLAQKERQFQDALVTASSIRIEALGDDPVVTPGQAVNVRLALGNRGPEAVAITGWSASGFKTPVTCTARTLAAGGTTECATPTAIPDDAKSSDIYFRHDPKFARYVFDPAVPFGVPFTPTPFRASVNLTIHSEAVRVDLPVEARYGGDIFAGEKRSELLVAPAVTLAVTPDLLVAPAGRVSQKVVRVTVKNNSRGRVEPTVHLRVPAGWSVTPASVPVSMGREDEEAVARFTVVTPPNVPAGEATLTAEATMGAQSFATNYQVVEYPHIRKRLLFKSADASLKVIDVRVAPNITVGYVMGVGDKVPDAIQQLGVPVTMLTADDLSWGDLSKYSVIMTGVRAYERRPDLRANNSRLIDYVSKGGVVLENYSKTEFNQAKGGYGPYPAVVTTDRITDENAPVKILVSNHPVFNAPNVIGPATWTNWVQERGTYFLGERATQYIDLVEMTDPFPNNAGPKRGALVEARYGKGRWIYIGLVLWRELPAGVPGAYQLLANLLSLR